MAYETMTCEKVTGAAVEERGREQRWGFVIDPPGWAEPNDRTVLVVESEPITRNVLVRAMTRLGYRVLEAANCEEALRICRYEERRIDLLITGLVLRDGTGTALAAKLSDPCPGLAVLLTSSLPPDPKALMEHMRLCEAGIQCDLLTKPFAIPALDSKVAGLLWEHRVPS